MTFKDLRDEKTVPVIEANQEGIIIQINKAFEHAYGWKKEVLAGEPITKVIPTVLREAHHMGFSRHIQTGRSTVLGNPTDLAILSADGSETVATHYILQGEVDGEKRYIASITPITPS